ncbi:MAG: AlpA family phage regulatory protein [Burkholderiaceae bacterium]|jgi:prophage regulatory protein|nr:AlpA family phage regulatory protein [Burkholderiaceae bacterium]
MSKQMQILRIKQVQERTGLSKSTIWRLCRKGEFPKSFPIGGSKCTGWLASEIDAFISKSVPVAESAK